MVEYAQTTYGTVDPVRSDARGFAAAPLARMPLVNNSRRIRGKASLNCRETDRRSLSRFSSVVASPFATSPAAVPIGPRSIRCYGLRHSLRGKRNCSPTHPVLNTNCSMRCGLKQIAPASTRLSQDCDNVSATVEQSGSRRLLSRGLKEPRIFESAPAP